MYTLIKNIILLTTQIGTHTPKVLVKVNNTNYKVKIVVLCPTTLNVLLFIWDQLP